MADETALQEKRVIQVAHAIPGRVRLRITDKTFEPALDALADELRLQDGIYEVCKNPETGSVLISFNSTMLALPALLEELEAYGVAGLNSQTSAANQIDPFAAWKKQGQLLLPVIAGLLLTRSLGLFGWRAIFAYIITADTTREIINILDSEKPIMQSFNSPESNIKNGSKEVSETQHSVENSPPKIEYRLLHAIRGRVRFGVPRLATDPEYAARLEQLSAAAAGVREVRVNPAAASIVISYNAGAVSDAQMHSYIAELIQSAGSPQILTEPAPTPETEAEIESEKVIDLSPKFPPLTSDVEPQIDPRIDDQALISNLEPEISELSLDEVVESQRLDKLAPSELLPASFEVPVENQSFENQLEIETIENRSTDLALLPAPTDSSIMPASLDQDDELDEFPDDIEMSLFDHLEELRQRIFYSLIAVFLGIVGCFVFVKPIVQILEVPAQSVKFIQIAPGEYFFVSMKTAGYSGLLVATPFILYQIIQFVLPGLTKRERRFLGPIVIGSSFLFVGGLAFAYFALIPAALQFLISYGADVVEQLLSIDRYFEFILLLLFSTGIAFQIPVIQMLLGLLGIVSSKQMLSGWRYVFLGAAILGAVLTPSTDPLTQCLLGGAVVTLYFGGTGLVMLLGR